MIASSVTGGQWIGRCLAARSVRLVPLNLCRIDGVRMKYPRGLTKSFQYRRRMDRLRCDPCWWIAAHRFRPISSGFCHLSDQRNANGSLDIPPKEAKNAFKDMQITTPQRNEIFVGREECAAPSRNSQVALRAIS